MRLRNLSVLVGLFALAGFALADPTPTAVAAGSYSEGATVDVDGTGFGPNSLSFIFEDFESVYDDQVTAGIWPAYMDSGTVVGYPAALRMTVAYTQMVATGNRPRVVQTEKYNGNWSLACPVINTGSARGNVLTYYPIRAGLTDDRFTSVTVSYSVKVVPFTWDGTRQQYKMFAITNADQCCGSCSNEVNDQEGGFYFEYLHETDGTRAGVAQSWPMSDEGNWDNCATDPWCKWRGFPGNANGTISFINPYQEGWDTKNQAGNGTDLRDVSVVNRWNNFTTSFQFSSALGARDAKFRRQVFGEGVQNETVLGGGTSDFIDFYWKDDFCSHLGDPGLGTGSGECFPNGNERPVSAEWAPVAKNITFRNYGGGWQGVVNHVYYLDDIFISVNNGQARVMLSNGPTYYTSSIFEVQAPTQWDDDEIRFPLRWGKLSRHNPVYVYVMHQDGTVNSEGALLTKAPIVIPQGGTRGPEFSDPPGGK